MVYQKYHLKWPWTPTQVNNLDDMLGTLFTALNTVIATATIAVETAATTAVTSNSGSTIFITEVAEETPFPAFSAPTPGLSDPVTALHGGTGLTSFAVGDLLYADATTSLARLAAPATGQVLISNGVGVAPSWSATPSLTTLSLTKSAIGVISTDCLVLQNTTPATGGTPAQWSPRIRWSGTAFNSVSGLSETSSWWAEVVTLGAAGPTTASLAFKALVNGVTTQPFFMTSAGALSLLNQLSAPIIAINNNGFIIALANAQFVVENNTATAGVGLDVGTDTIMKVRTRAHTGYATVDALGYSVSGVAGASKAAGPVASITVVNGIVTAIS